MDLSYFETINEQDEVSFIRPETKSIEALERVILLSKPLSVVDKFIALYLVGIQWDWFEAYQAYLIELEEVMLYNQNPPTAGKDEAGNNIAAEKKPLPLEPVRPPLLTVEEFKTNTPDLFRQYNKLNAFEFNGVVCSVCEADQHGWSDLMLANMTKDSLGMPYEPIPFSNENGNVVVLETREQWNAFYLAAWATREVFFKLDI